MRKADFYKKINRNSKSIFNTSPEVIVEQIWLGDEMPAAGVQIIELKSDNSSGKSRDDDKDRMVNDAWNEHHERLQRIEQNFEVNTTAREKRRLRNMNENQRLSSNSFSVEDAYDAEYSNDFGYSDFYGSGSNDVGRASVLNHQMNCFTIIDKRYTGNSESTSENEYTDIELLNCEDSGADQAPCDRPYETEMIAYDQERDTEKHTVWIYSFKNKHLLSENDFELVNIPSQDTTSTTPSSIEDVEKAQIENNQRHRVPTPIPSSYVPRLNLTLTPTLPTVTEVTEPKKQSSCNQTDKQSIEKEVKPKTINNWFLSERDNPPSDVTEFCQSSHVVNWMALSPRDKRRNFSNRSPLSAHNFNLPPVREVSSYAEKKVQRSGDNSKKAEPTVQVHTVAEVEQYRAIKSIRTPVSSHILKNPVGIEDSIRAESEESIPDERGDGNNKNHRSRPNIRLSPKPITGLGITDPIEKLDGDNWIDEEHLQRPDEEHQMNKKKDTRHVHGDCAGNILLQRNMSLLKPADWSEYLPIAESLPSLNVTMTTESNVAALPWFKRLIKFFRCCK